MSKELIEQLAKLTDGEIINTWDDTPTYSTKRADLLKYARAIEALVLDKVAKATPDNLKE
jgi:hypothetical protein